MLESWFSLYTPPGNTGVRTLSPAGIFGVRLWGKIVGYRTPPGNKALKSTILTILTTLEYGTKVLYSLPGGTAGYPAHPRLIRPSVRPSVCNPF